MTKLSPAEKLVRDTVRNGEKWMKDHGVDPNEKPPADEELDQGKSLEQIKQEESEMGLSEVLKLHKYGKPYSRFSRESEKVTVVPTEIEMPSELYEFITHTVLEYNDWSLDWFINELFNERMKQILSDPKEFGEMMLGGVKSNHCLQNTEYE